MAYDRCGMPIGCTSEARISIETLRDMARLTPNITLMVVFGSHARGDATPTSDLDIIYVKKRSDPLLYGELEKSIRRSGMHAHTLVPHTAASLRKDMNLYGTMEYWAMCEGVVIYDNGSSQAGGSILQHMIRYDSDTVRVCAPLWMQVAQSYITTSMAYERRNRRDNGFRCHALYMAVASIIKAILTHNRILFPFTRTLRPLYNMLPDKSIINDVCGLDTILGWERRVIDGVDRKTHSEAVEASGLTKRIHANTRQSLYGKEKQHKGTAVH